MAVSHSYAPNASAQNVWTVTGAGSFTLADMVTYDEANALTLLDAVACNVNLTLTYQIRPASQRALVITFTLAGTTAGAGDTLDVTGTDAWGNAQNESIDVSAGDGAYNGAYRWATITDIDCTGWADGTLTVTQPIKGFIWSLGDLYTIIDLAKITLGNDSDATQLVDSGFVLYCDEPTSGANQTFIQLTNQTTLTLSKFSIVVNTANSTTRIIQGDSAGGTAYYYQLLDGNVQNTGAGTCQLLYTGAGATSYITNCSFINAQLNYMSCDLTNIDLFGSTSYSILSSNGVMDNIIFTGTPNYHIHTVSNVALDVNNASNDDSANISTFYLSSITVDKYCTDCVFTEWTVTWAGAAANTHSLYRRYTCNINVKNKDGTALQNVTVTCKDKDGTQVFSVSTDGSGDITEQYINYIRYYYDGGGTSYTYSSHTFTFELAGYRTMVIDAITVDYPIVWEMEMQRTDLLDQSGKRYYYLNEDERIRAY